MGDDDAVRITQRDAIELARMLKWFREQVPGAGRAKKLQPPRGVSRSEIAVAQESIARGASGDVKFKRGAVKGSETVQDKIVTAYNRRFGTIAADDEVMIEMKSNGWEIVSPAISECSDLSNLRDVAGFDSAVMQVLVHMPDDGETPGCLAWIDTDEDCE